MKRLLLIILPLLLIVGCAGFQFNHVSIERTFKDSIKKGVYTFRYENGQKQYEGNFKDGKEVGLHTWWYQNGQKKFERTFKDGKLVEIIGRWNEDGSVKE